QECSLALNSKGSLQLKLSQLGDFRYVRAMHNARGDIEMLLDISALQRLRIEATANLLGEVENDLGLPQESARELVHTPASGEGRRLVAHVNWGTLSLKRL